MKNKNIIKRILFEGSHQISAVLPRSLNPAQALNTFVYKIPVILNKDYFLKNSETKIVDYFKIIFYKNESFNNDFKSKFYEGASDFKKFRASNEGDINSIASDDLKSITKNFYQDGEIANDHYTVNFKESSITNQDLYIYNITLPNSASKEIKDKNYSCMRIFAVKNNNVVDDTDFIFFENDNFLEDVYNTKKIYDLQYFISEVYLLGFADSLNIDLPSDASTDYEKLKIIKSSQFDDSMIRGDIKITIDFESSVPTTSTSQTMHISTFNDNSTIEVNNSNFFENIVKLYMTGLDIFVFRILCELTINPEEGNQTGAGVFYVFEKQRAFDRNDSFIRKVIDTYKNQFLTRLFNRCDFRLNSIANSNYIEVILSSNDLEERQLLSLFRVDSVKNYNTEYSDGGLYSSSNLSTNDKINFIGLNLHELTLNSNQVFKFYIPNYSISPPSKIKIKISSGSFIRQIESNTFSVNPDYENLFNKVNKNFRDSILIESNGLNRNASSDGCFTSYKSFKINNVQRKFGELAYDFGYYDQQGSQNTQTASDVLDFFKSSIFSIELEESLINIDNARHKKKQYFFGNQIIESELIQEDSIKLKPSFLSTHLKINIATILNNAVIKSSSSLNTIKVIGSFGNEFNENDRVPIDILNFLSDNNFHLNKSIKIKIIPIPKLIKIYQTQTYLEENLNIAFPEGVSNDIKNSINLSFVDLFYDKNSSLNWNRFLNFKKLYFERSNDSNLIVDTASYLSSIWDYLSSSIYIKESSVFIKREAFTKVDAEALLVSEKLDTFSNEEYTNSEDITNNIMLNDITTNSYFEDSSTKYFNFQINNKNIITIENTGLVVNFKKIGSSLNQPKNIEIVNVNINKEKRIDLDISGLKKYFNNQGIRKMNFLVKMSIHPLIRKEDYSLIPTTTTELTDFISTTLDTSQQFYCTQNNNYMTGVLSNYFFDYGKPINKSNARFYETDESLKLSLFAGNNRRNISSSTFKELFEFCINNNATILEDFFLRIGFSFEINNNYYYANIYKKLNRNNLNDSLVDINRVESIKEI
jgi:hypothetical protein